VLVINTAISPAFFNQSLVGSGPSVLVGVNANESNTNNAAAVVSAGGAQSAKNQAEGEPSNQSADPLSNNKSLEANADEQTEINLLTEAEQEIVDELAARDREVRAHEAAHANAGGRYAGSPTYTFERGPDGNSYAVGGQVSIDVSPIPNDPQATIQKARIVRRAALAPAEPSPQDRAVANEAIALERQATAELLEIKAEEFSEANENNTSTENIGESTVDSNSSNNTPGQSRDFQSLLKAIEASAISADTQGGSLAPTIDLII